MRRRLLTFAVVAAVTAAAATAWLRDEGDLGAAQVRAAQVGAASTAPSRGEAPPRP